MMPKSSSAVLSSPWKNCVDQQIGQGKKIELLTMQVGQIPLLGSFMSDILFNYYFFFIHNYAMWVESMSNVNSPF